MPQETFSNLQPIKGETFSSVTPIGSTPAQPGFFTRLGQSLGLPTSQADVDNLAPTSIKDALMQAAKASTGFLPALVNYGRTAAKGFSEGKQDIDEAATNIGQGGPVLSNIGKAVSGAIHASLQATPVVGPSIDTAGQDVSQGNLAGAAGGLTGVIGQIAAPKIIEGASDLAGKTVDAAKEAFGEPTPTPPLPELPKPVSTPLQVDSPFDDATIRKTSGKDLSPDARETLRNAAGPVIPAGSSPELHLLKAVPEVNATIATEGAKLDGILDNAGPLDSTPQAAVSDAIDALKAKIPKSVRANLSQDADEQAENLSAALKSNDPKVINDTIRQLDEGIKDYNAANDPNLDTAGKVKQAAQVTIRRVLRNTLNENIPETKPVNQTLGNNIEVRSVLRNRLGDVADDSSAANAQYQSELAKGQAQLQRDTANQCIADELAARKSKVSRNRILAGVGASAVGGGGLYHVASKLIP